MSSCPPIQAQPPDIEELCTDTSRIVPRKKSSMSPKLSQEDHKANSQHVSELLRNVSEGNVVAFCTCQQSKDFPFCDNTHTKFNKATNANLSPLYVAIVEGKCTDCGSKKDKNGLSHSMDHTSETCNSRGCNDSATSCNILNNSTNTHSTACKCKPNKLTVSTPEISLDNHLPSKVSHPTLTTKSTSTQTTPTGPTQTPSTSISTSKPLHLPSTNTITDTPTDTTNTCNNTTNIEPTTRTQVYEPSSSKSPINQKNIITRAEVAVHATVDDLWMIINGNVYDITDYVQYHPGGVRALAKFAGKDGSENVHYHSSRMLQILNQSYFIGKLPRAEGGPGGGCIIS